jgi:transcriptional regulator with XRE-family HTH domain
VNNKWKQRLKHARLALGLTQAELARIAGVAEDTVRAVESGRRRPSRATLGAILEGMKLDLKARNEILFSAGFAPIATWFPPERAPHYSFTLEEATEEVEKYPWPAFVVNTLMEVLAANTVCQRLWGVNLDQEFNTPVERNLLSVASSPRFADKVQNWDEAVSAAIAVVKDHAETQPEGSSPYYAAVMQHFLAGDPRYIKRFLDQWERTPARSAKIRWTYPIVWGEPGVGLLRFLCFVSAGSEPEGIGFNDWIPLDGETWQALKHLGSPT